MQRLARRLVLFLPLSAALFWPAGVPAQTPSGTLHLPDHRQTETPPRAPTAAPTTAVHEEGHHTPVVQPRHGETRHKPPVQHSPPARHPAAHTVPPHPPAAHAAPPKPETKPPPAHEATAPPPPKPAPATEPDKGASTGLPLPRFAALRTDEVNLRSGPGTRYPIEWVYKRRYLPVEIEREFDNWRLVRMPDGTRGWVHQATLTGRRSFDVEQQEATLRAEPRETARAVAHLKPGVVGRIRSCSAGSDWCRVQVGNYGGYLRRNEIWGVRPNEALPP